jgi:small-conductance mechanosensitive channel
MPQPVQKKWLPLLLLFCVITVLFLPAGFWAGFHVNNVVVLVANLLLFVISLLTTFMHTSAAQKTASNALTTSIMGSMLLKMFVFAIAVLVYSMMAKSQRNVPGIFVGMFLYLLYLVLEVRIALGFTKKQKTDAGK